MAISKEERAAQAKKHLSLMKGVFASETQVAIDSAQIFEDGEGRELEIPEARAEQTETEVSTQFAAACASAQKGKVLIVDPTAFTRPGGNYEEGSFGPEQALCSDSNLYPILQGLKSEYHDKNRGYGRGMLFTDRCVYLQDVTFNRGGSVAKHDVLAIPEPVRGRALENHRSENECDQALANRIETILRVAAFKGCDVLVVGAFGCGRNGYDAGQVIELFEKWISAHQGVIPKIVFAVPRFNFEAFDSAFGKPAPVVEEVEVPEEEEEAYEFDPSDLPEGITFR